MTIQSLLQKITKASPNSNLVERAFKFAEIAHQGQKRFSGENYIQHPIRVAQILTEMRLDSKAIAAGFLHDIPDDTEKTLEDIEKEFGKEVAFLVEGVSKLGKLRYPKTGLEVKPAEERIEESIDLKAENLRKMFLAMGEDLRVILIKLADRLHNMETLGSLPPEKQKRIALETLEIFAPLANRLGMGDIKGKLEDLSFPYLYPKEYEWLVNNVNIREKFEARNKYLEKVKPFLIKVLKEEGIKPIEVSSRSKYYWSLYQKLLRHETNFERIYDLVALKIVLDNVESCYKVLGIIHKYWKPLPGRIKDYIAFPKPNGYQSLHTTCFCLDGKITEIQIKTKKMQEEAEYGICAHWAAKEGVDSKTQKRKFSWVAQLKDWQSVISKSGEFWEGLKIDFFRNRIFVFTPKGDVIDLPEGATPVDFAYAVHTNIGNCCAGAKVNGKLCLLSHPLKNGEVVEIMVDKNKRPSRDWLDFVKTSMARSRIREWLKKESRPENLNRGIKLLDQEFQTMKGTPWSKISQPQKEKLIKAFPHKDLESLIVAIGQGEISPREIFRFLFKEKDVLEPRPSKTLPKTVKKPAEVILAGETGLKIHLAKCCLPRVGEKIEAYITKERRTSIHKINCLNLAKTKQKWPQKIIEASWAKEEKLLYTVCLRIKVEDRLGLVRDITSAISSLNLNISDFRSEVKPPDKMTAIKAWVDISGLEDLDKLFGQLKQVNGVMEISKV